MSAAVLEVDNLSRAFGGVQAVDRVSFTLRPGEIVGLIGPNGAGKTTLVNLITGVVTAGSGTVRFEGHDVTRQRPWQAARRGLARTFQVVQPFPEMTVLDNVAAGALFAGHAELPLSQIDDSHEEGARILASAKRILTNIGKPASRMAKNSARPSSRLEILSPDFAAWKR